MTSGATQALLAAVPVAVLLTLMALLRWPAWAAGLAGLGATFAVAVAGFGYGRAVLPELGVVGASAGALAEAGFTALTILWIIVPALAIHQVQLATGATDVLRLAMGRLSRDPGIAALLVAWFFALFMEGAAGFGASVALAAPFLVSAGFRRVDAITVALIGHAVGVSFGAVGTPIIPQVAATGLSAGVLAQATAVYHALLGWLPITAAMLLVARTTVPGFDRSERIGLRALLAWTALAAALFLAPYLAIAWFVGPELPTLGGALIGGLAFVALLRRHAPRPVTAAVVPPDASTAPVADPASARRVVRAAAPYLVLVGLVVGTRLVPPVSQVLQGVSVAWSLPGGFAGTVQPLYHPGTMLLGGLAGGALLQRVSGRELGAALRRALGQLGAVTVALVAMLALSRLMVHAGLTAALADAAGFAAGGSWPLFAPLVGALGTS